MVIYVLSVVGMKRRIMNKIDDVIGHCDEVCEYTEVEMTDNLQIGCV